MFAFRNQSGRLTRIERSLNAVSSYSFFYTFHTDHVEEKVSHSFGLLVILILETIVKFFITVTVRFGVEIKVKHPVLRSERFDLKKRIFFLWVYFIFILAIFFSNLGEDNGIFLFFNEKVVQNELIFCCPHYIASGN